MNARLHRTTALLLVLASLMASGLARAETPAPAAAATAQATQAQPAPTHKDIVAWQRVGAPTSLEA